MFSSAFSGKNSQMLMQFIFPLGMVFAFMFIALFMKEVVMVINKAMVASLTLSFVLLVLNNVKEIEGALFYVALALCIILPYGIIGIVIPKLGKFLNSQRYQNVQVKNQDNSAQDKSKNTKKWQIIAYIWCLFINFCIAYIFFQKIGAGSFNLGFLSAKTPLIDAFIMGMLIVQVLMNAGMLYYGFLFGMVSSEMRTKTFQFIEDNLVSNQQFTSKQIILILVIQVILFSLFRLISSLVGFHFLILWVLLTPILLRIYARLRLVAYKKL